MEDRRRGGRGGNSVSSL